MLNNSCVTLKEKLIKFGMTRDLGEDFKQPRHESAHERVVGTREVTFTCKQCKKTVTQWRLPAPFYFYCSDRCAQKSKREKQRLRMRERRGSVHRKPGRPGRPTVVKRIDVEIEPYLEYLPDFLTLLQQWKIEAESAKGRHWQKAKELFREIEKILPL